MKPKLTAKQQTAKINKVEKDIIKEIEKDENFEYKTLSDLPKNLNGIKNIDIECRETIRTDDFKSEKLLKKFITENLTWFCKETLNDKLIRYAVEKPLNKRYKRYQQPKRADIYVECEKTKAIIELKNPKCSYDNRAAIGQLLDYGRELYCGNKGDLILVTTMFDQDTASTIVYYNLPIKYVYLDKKRIISYV